MKKLLFLACTLLALLSCSPDNSPEGGGGAASGSEYLNVGNVEIPGGNTTATLNIQASNNCNWVISWSEPWIRSISPTSGRGSNNVTITVTVNPSSSAERSAVLIVKNASGSISRNVTVTQSPNAESLQLSTESVNFTYKTGSQDVSVTSNTHWTITGSANWLSLNTTEGDNDGSVKLTVDENTTESERSVVLLFKGAEGSERQLRVTQEGRSTDFSVSPTNISTDATAKTLQISIVGDAHWTAQSNQDWAILNDVSGQGYNTLTVTLSINTAETERTAVVTISSSKKSEMVTINQSAIVKTSITDFKISNISRREAVVEFNYNSMYPVTEYGVCYSESPNPTVYSLHIAEVGTLTSGYYSSKLTGLLSGTSYHVRCYVKNAVGYDYSEEIFFTTLQGDQPNADDNPHPSW